MKLVKVITNQDKFFGNVTFDFEDEVINTISGKNGSGKTSLFELISLVQKAYFCDALLKNNYFVYNNIQINEWISQLILERLSQENANIILVIKFERKDFEILKSLNKHNRTIQDLLVDDTLIEITLTNEGITEKGLLWKIEVEENEDILRLFWNLKAPQGFIVYISADRKVSEENVMYSDIELQGINEISNKVQVILSGEDLFNNLYNIMI